MPRVLVCVSGRVAYDLPNWAFLFGRNAVIAPRSNNGIFGHCSMDAEERKKKDRADLAAFHDHDIFEKTWLEKREKFLYINILYMDTFEYKHIFGGSSAHSRKPSHSIDSRHAVAAAENI